MSGRLYRQVRAPGVVDDGPFPRPSGGRRPGAVVPLKSVLGDAILQRLVEAFARSLWRDYENATVRIARVPMRDATRVAISVDNRRLGQAAELLWKYRLAKAKPYEPVLV